jgi:hypothetical protein
MFGRAGVLLLPLLFVGIWLVHWSRRRQRRLEFEALGRGAELVGYRKAVGWRWAGLVLGVVAALKTASIGSLGLWLMLAPTVFGLCVIGGVALGEVATIPRREGVRTAALETRTIGRYLPRRLSGLVAAGTAGLGALLVATTLMGSADDLGRAGRSLSRQCSPTSSASHSPWPGWYYSVPLGLAVAVGLLGAVFALRMVVLRPRRGSAPGLVAADDVLRRRSAEAVVAATGVIVAASLFAVALLAGARLISFDCSPASWTTFGAVLLAVAVAALLLTGGCLALLLVGPRIHSTESGDTAVAGQAVHQ